jgi:excisionase family DNA binding protein
MDDQLTYYTVARLAERWGCSRNRIYGMIRRGELAAVYRGTCKAVPAAEVERAELRPAIPIRS